MARHGYLSPRRVMTALFSILVLFHVYEKRTGMGGKGIQSFHSSPKCLLEYKKMHSANNTVEQNPLKKTELSCTDIAGAKLRKAL